MTEKDKMISGQLYDPMDPELIQGRELAHDLCHEMGMLKPSDRDTLDKVSARLLPNSAPFIFITPPFFCDYGWNIYAGQSFYCNTGCVILDCAPVKIGDHVLFGPNVQIYTALHPLDPDERADLEYALPVTIGDKVWIGGGSIVCAGVNIGNGVVIGAGSVVTRSIPDYSLAVGNPCRVIRSLKK